MDASVYKKTTVQFPPNILRGLRQYVINHDLTSHDQSKVIVTAVQKFLEADNIELYPEKTTKYEDFQVDLQKILKKHGLDEHDLQQIKSGAAKRTPASQEITTTEREGLQQPEFEGVSASSHEGLAKKVTGFSEK
jgi:hypothetical protein